MNSSARRSATMRDRASLRGAKGRGFLSSYRGAQIPWWGDPVARKIVGPSGWELPRSGPSDQPFPSGTQVGTALPTDLHTADLHPAVTFFAMTKPLRATDTGAKCPTTVGCVVTNPSRPARSIYRYQGSTSIPGNSINNLWLKLPTALGDPYSNGGWVLFPRQ